MIKREYSWSVDGVPAATRELARELQRGMRKQGAAKHATKILQSLVTKSQKYVR